MATKDEIFAFAAQEAERQGVPLSLVQGVVDTESGGIFNAIGPKTKTGDRAYGPMQLMSSTAKDLGVNRMEWKDNIRGGVKYLNQLSQRYDNPDLVLAAYNAGLGNVDKYGGIPPFKETQNYVQKVKNFMAKSTTDDEFVPFGQGTTTQAPTQTVGADDFVPFGGKQQVQQQTQQRQAVPTTADFMQSVRQQAFQPKTQFQQDVAASFNPLDVLRGKTTSGQLIFGAADLMSQGIKGGLSALGLSDEYLGIDRNKPQPTPVPTQSISDILKGTYKVATERPGLLVGGLGTGIVDPATLLLPGAIQKSIVSATPQAIAQMAPRTVALAQNIGTGGATAALTSAAAQQATTGTINPAQMMNEAAVGGLLTAPTATVSALTTPRAPANLTQKQLIAQRAMQQGATFVPSEVNPTILNNLLEAFSSKPQTKQLTSIKNAEIGNAAARKFLGVDPDTAITLPVLNKFREDKGQFYDALRSNKTYYTDQQFLKSISDKLDDLNDLAPTNNVLAEINTLKGLQQLNFNSKGFVEQMKRLKKDSGSNLISQEPANRNLGEIQRFAVNQMEDLAERNLTNIYKQPDVVKNFKQAREDIAKSYTLQKSLNLATGDVSLAELGQRAKRGKIVPAELQVLADAAAAYPNSFQNVARIGSAPGPNLTDLAAGTVGAVSTGNAGALGAIFGRPLGRNLITSPMYQRNLLPSTTPQAPGLLNRITSDPLTNYGLGQLPEYGTDRFLLPR
jgi:hypothetical protein